MIDETEVAERVAVTLRAKAAEVTTPTRGFDPERGSRLSPEPLQVPWHLNGSRRWRMLAVAATALVVAAAGGVLVSTSGGDPEPIGPATETGPAEDEDAPASTGTPDDILAPGWVPDDLQLWDLSWRYGKVPDMSGGDQLQLFMADDGEARVLVEVTSPLDWGSEERVTVRGQQGWRIAGEAREAVKWDEKGVSVMAAFSGISQEDAVTFVDSLTWLSEDPQEGFEAPEGAPLSLVGETSAGTDPEEALNANFTYGYDVPTVSFDHDEKLSIMTSKPLGDADGTLSGNYLNAWFDGSRDEDGTVTSLDFFPETGGSPASAMVERSAADGSHVFVFGHYDGLTEENVQEIADSISAVSGGDLDDLRRSVSDLYADLPVAASAELPSATVTLRGQEEFGALCIEVGDADVTCSVTLPTVGSGTRRRLTSVHVDGEWYVAAASPEEAPLVTEGGVSAEDLEDAMGDYSNFDPEAIAQELANKQGGSPEELEIDSETGTDGEWQFVLAVPPADIDDVTVWFGTMYGVLSRSTSP